MNAILRPSLFGAPSPSPWHDPAPVREEMFGVERLEQHAQSLAAAQPVTLHPPRVLSLHKRLNANAGVLLAAYRASAAAVEHGQEVVPAAEWLLDNYHLVDEQIREIREDLPPGYYRQLPNSLKAHSPVTPGYLAWPGLLSPIPTAISTLAPCAASSMPISGCSR